MKHSLSVDPSPSLPSSTSFFSHSQHQHHHHHHHYQQLPHPLFGPCASAWYWLSNMAKKLGSLRTMLVLVGLVLMIATTVFRQYLHWSPSHQAHGRGGRPSWTGVSEYVPLLEAARISIDDHVDRERHAVALLSPLLEYHRDHHRISETTQSAKDILCSTYLSWSDNNVNRLVNAMSKLGGHCDWVVTIYNDRGHSLSDMQRQLGIAIKLTSLLNPSALQRFLPKDTNNGNTWLSSAITIQPAVPREKPHVGYREICHRHIHKFNSVLGANWTTALPVHPCVFFNDYTGQANLKTYPKVAMMIGLLDFVEKYEYVWILDGDLSFEGFDMSRFVHTHHCAFARPPLVAQPLIVESKPFYKFLSRSYWLAHRKQPLPVASTIGFVEIQLPFIKSQYLEWFLLAFVIPMFPAMHITGGDWGFDELFCKSAEFFAAGQTRLHSNRAPASTDVALASNFRKNRIDEKRNRDSISSSCALILSSAVHHADDNEISGQIGSRHAKVMLNKLLRDKLLESYSHFYYPGRLVKESLEIELEPRSWFSSLWSSDIPAERSEVSSLQSNCKASL